ncbi:TIGR03086 family metal-binding protein [Lentzea californiensis]|uniref:TIGR03086 family metal-binding protein n=1 Tax=Lentzea californiensis TaxID=438851 RepID=UPI002165A74E|nr:TIGR03086 family metal-binding protein [Lentzea californiensis]MCR3750503.1 TIGR03086 family protein [Lentzea californiensis]
MIDLKPACHRMAEVLHRVTDDQLTSSSPCAEYTVADLIDHVDLVSRGSAALARRDSGELPDTEDAHSSPGWRDSVAQHVLALGKAWDEPAAWQGRTDVGGLELPNEVWGKIALTELVVHGWDIAKATGQPFDLPEHTVRACFDHVAEFVPAAPVPALWGPPATVAPDATLLDQIVAITGRVP